jgi:putative salt-induced outer membrane protein YdiY
VVPDSGLSTNSTFVISGLGKDGFDWLQLKTAEWLKGRLRDIRNDKVKFESEKLEDLTFKLSDVRYLYCANPMFIKFQGQDQIYGTVVVSNNLVQVVAAEQIQLPREQLTGITPAGKHELDLWSFKMSAGVNFQAGNTKQTTVNTSAEVTRRTPATQFLLNYLGNFSEVEGEQNANNHRINLSYDVRLSRNWFLRPVQAEYYRDQLANIAHRATAGIGLGYYILDSEGLEWKVAAGPGYQYTRFSTVEPGTSDSASTPAAFLQSEFEADITSRLTLIQTFSSTLASDEAGLYSHHWVTTLEFELKKSLDLNLSFVWDYLQNPRIEANGVVPQRSDLRLTLGLGVKF